MERRSHIVVDARVLLAGAGVALIGVVVAGLFLWMVPKAAARESTAACSGLRTSDPNPALCPAGAQGCKFPLAAPDFTAIDNNGKQVHLSDFRGKVVLLNFWATWCVPCKASFPAMTKFMQRHPEVVFLFIATQEKPEGAVQRVKDYITKQGYPFHVLMDEPEQGDARKFKALMAYKPQGIPAKAVIDAQGKQRFLSIGFSSDTELMNELEAMVQLAKE